MVRKAQVQLSKRTGKNRQLSMSALIICEGVTEYDYLHEFRKKYNLTAMKIYQSDNPQPIKIIEYAKNKNAINVQYEKVFCVFDVDDNSQLQLNQAQKDGKVNNMHLIISNPCFEYWLLLHFEYTTGFLTVKNAKDKLKKHIDDYNKTSVVNYNLLNKDKLLNAVENAQKIHKNITILKQFIINQSNPSTNMYELINYFNYETSTM